MARSGRLVEGDVVAHGFELANSVVAGFLGVEAGEVVPAGVVVGGVGRGDVPDRDEQCALNGDVGFQGAAASGDPPIFGEHVGFLLQWNGFLVETSP